MSSERSARTDFAQEGRRGLRGTWLLRQGWRMARSPTRATATFDSFLFRGTPQTAPYIFLSENFPVNINTNLCSPSLCSDNLKREGIRQRVNCKKLQHQLHFYQFQISNYSFYEDLKVVRSRKLDLRQK